jgi:SAM-dependent methyltransferase
VEAAGDGLLCPGCDTRYAIREGIPVFHEGVDFYEGYAEEHIPYVTDPPPLKRAVLRFLPYHSWREWSFFRRHLRLGSSAIDLGCGRGKGWFSARAGFIAGVDPCWTALRECTNHYDLAVQADIGRLPFKDGTFDVAITSHVLGHIPESSKDGAVSEIARVLKPGGRTLNIIETDSEHPFVRGAKEHPDLYQRNFIDTDGHVGLELPSAVLERFRRHGLEPVEVRKMESGRLWPRYYEKFKAIGYPDLDPEVRAGIRRWRRISSRPALLGACEVVMGTYHRVIEQRTTPLDHAMFIMLCAEKRAG